ncbi:MAG: hypothetical protein IPJ20_23465 [Flammeovirgaceae bacterium]|nr:hypothetical protein [Flammeovirgaceae bacterium]
MQPVAYDIYGRAQTAYLPYAAGTNEGILRTKALTNGGYTNSEQYLFYQSTSKVATYQTVCQHLLFANSPTGKVLEQGAAGEEWQPGLGHTVRSQFMVNSSAATAPAAVKNIRIWSSANYPTGSIYADGALGVSKIVDENNKETWTFTDKLGRTVLVREQINETIEGQVIDYLETYYVYDVQGNLVMASTPKANAKLNSGTVWSGALRDESCFVYTYDARNRLLETKVPGAAVEYRSTII